MAKEVDTKVIQMEFDNSDFEKGAKETQNTINNLKNSIKDLSDSANGTESVDKVNRVVIDKLNVMATAVDQTVRRITDGVIGSVTRITGKFNELTFAPISAGFSKYEEQISSVQTIMNATNYSMEAVQKQLDKLMWYTDETSYSYSDMANNIGKFTSAGVKLEDAVTAMMGIANWAGVSGANVQQASRAMYNLSQAMGTGTLKLQDWMSIENANMATKEFKNNLIETAKELGTLSEETEVTAENMRESLKSGWVTADVLTKTLKKYGNYTEELYKIQIEENLDGATEAMERYAEKYADLAVQLHEAYTSFGEDSTEFKNLVTKNGIIMETAMDLVSVQAAKEYNKGLEELRKKLVDISERYGMDSEQFRDEAEKNGKTLKEAAKMVKEGIDSFKKAEQSLGEKSLRASQEAKTFKDAWEATIDGVSSGWLKFWEGIWGNYEQAKKLWTWFANNPLYDTFVTPVKALAQVMQGASKLGFSENILEGFSLAWEHIYNSVEAVKEAFISIFPLFENWKDLSVIIDAISLRFKEWAEALAFTDEKLEESNATTNAQLAQLKERAEKVFTIIKAVGDILFNIFINTARVIKALLPSRETITNLLGLLFGFSTDVDTIVETVTNKITFFANVLIAVIYIIKNAAIVMVKTLAASLAIAITAVVDFFNSDVFNTIITIASRIGNALLTVGVILFGTLSFLLEGVFNVLDAIVGVIMQLAEAPDKLKILKSWIEELGYYFGFVKVFFDSIKKTFEVVITVVRHFIDAIAEFISKIDVWRAALILLVLSMIQSGLSIGWFIAQFIGGIGSIFKKLFIEMNPIKTILSKFLNGVKDAIDELVSIIDVAKLEAIGHLLLAYGHSVLILAAAALILSTIPTEIFKSALIGVATLMGILLIFMGLCNAFIKDKTVKTFKELTDSNNLKETIETITKTFSLGTELFGIAAVLIGLTALVHVLGEVYRAVGNVNAFVAVLGGVGLLLLSIFGILAIVQNIVGKINERKTEQVSIKVNDVSGSISKLALSLVGIALSIAVLTFLNPDGVKDAFIALGITAGVLIAFMIALSAYAESLVKRYDHEKLDILSAYLNGFGKAMSAVGGAVRNLSIGALLLSRIPAEKLWSVIGALGVVTLYMVALIGMFTLLLQNVTGTYEKNTNNAINRFYGVFGLSSGKNISKKGVNGSDIILAGLALKLLADAMLEVMLGLIPLSLVPIESITMATVYITLLFSLMSLVLMAFTESLGTQRNGKSKWSVNITSKDLVKIGQTLAIMALAIDLITVAIIPLVAAVLASELIGGTSRFAVERAVFSIIGLLASFAGYIVLLIGAMREYNKSSATMLEGDVFTSIGKSMMSMAIGIDLISVAILSIMGIKTITGASIGDATLSIVSVILAMTALLAAVINSLRGLRLGDNMYKVLSGLTTMIVIIGATVDMIAVAIAGIMGVGTIPGTKLLTVSYTINTILVLIGAMISASLLIAGKMIRNPSEVILSIGKMMLMMGGALDLIGLAIIGIMVAIGKLEIPTASVISVLAGIATITAEIMIYSGIMLHYSKAYPDLGIKLMEIAISLDLMGLAIGMIALSIGTMLKYGENTYAGIAAFAVLITIIGLYNYVMMQLLNKLPNTNTVSLMFIALDFAIMAAAIAMITPSVQRLTEVQSQLGGLNILYAVIQGVVVPLIAFYAAMWAFSNLAKTFGKGSTWGFMLILAVEMIALAGSVALLAVSARLLANVDTEKLSNIADTLVSLMLAFTVMVTVLAVVSNITGDSMWQLALSFALFTAAVWLAAEALDSVHTALKNIAEDQTIKDALKGMWDMISEDPGAAIAGTAIGTTMGLSAIFVLNSVLDNGVDSVVAAFTDGIKDRLNKALWGWEEEDAQGNKKKHEGFLPWIPKSIGEAVLGDTASGDIAKFFGFGVSSSTDAQGNIVKQFINPLTGKEMSTKMAGFTMLGEIAALAFVTQITADATAGLLAYFETGDESILEQHCTKYGLKLGKWIAKGVEEGNVFAELLSPLYRLAALISGDDHAFDKAFENNEIIVDVNTFWSKLSQAEKDGFKNFSGYDNEQDILDYLDSQFQSVSEYVNDYYFQHNHELPTVDIMADLFDMDNEQSRRVYQEVIDAYNEFYVEPVKTLEKIHADEREQRIKDETSNLETILKASFDMTKGEILSFNDMFALMMDESTEYDIKHVQNVEELRDAYAIARKNVLEYYGLEENAANAAAEAASDAADAKNEGTKKQIALLDTENENLEDIYSTSEDIATTEDLQNQSIAEGNHLLLERLGMLKLENSLSTGGIGNLLGLSNDNFSFVSIISKWVNKWKNSNINSLLSQFGGKGNINKSTLGQVFDLVNKNGGSLNKLSDTIKNILGLSQVSDSDNIITSIFNSIGGGFLNLDQIKNFDINDLKGSLGRIFNLNNAEGVSIFNDIFGITGNDLSFDSFIDKLIGTGDIDTSKIKDALTDAFGDVYEYETPTAGEGTTGDGTELLGKYAADSYMNGFTSAYDTNEMLNPMSGTNSSATEQAIDGFSEAGDLAAEAFRNSIQEQEDALKETATIMGEAYASAFNAAEEAMANPSLAQQNAEAINAQAESFEENKLYATAYKRQLDKDEANLKAAEEKLKKAEKAAEKKKYNADGSEDTSAQKALEAAKKEHEEAKAQYDATKAQYDAYIGQMKTAKEGYLDSKEKSEFQKNPKKLADAMTEANRERELLREALETGDFSRLPDYIKNVDDLIAALKATEERIATYEGIEQEVIAEDKADGEISGDIAPEYSEFNKQRLVNAKKRLKEDIKSLEDEKQHNNAMIKFYSRYEDEFSKSEVERLTKRNEDIDNTLPEYIQQYNNLGSKRYNELIAQRQSKQKDIDDLESAISEYYRTGVLKLPKRLVDTYGKDANWAKILQTWKVDLQDFDNQLKAVSNIGLENAEDRPEAPDYVSLAETVNKLTLQFDDLYLASTLFANALQEARGAAGSRMEELNDKKSKNLDEINALEGSLDEKDIKRANALREENRQIDEQMAGLSKGYNMLSAEDLQSRRDASKAYEKEIAGYDTLLSLARTNPEEFLKKSGGKTAREILAERDKAKERKAEVDKELGMLEGVFDKSGDISTETTQLNTDFNSLDLSTKELTSSFDNLNEKINPSSLDTTALTNSLDSIPEGNEERDKWVQQKTDYQPIDTDAIQREASASASAEVDKAKKELDTTYTTPTYMASMAKMASKDVALTKLDKLASDNLLEVTNNKLDELFMKLDDIYNNGLDTYTSMTNIETGVDGIIGSGIYLDGRTLIGKIAPDLDKILGGFAFRRGTV